MRKIKNAKKKKKDDLIEVPMSVRNRAMELIRKMCDEDTYQFLEIILNIQALEQETYMFSFKHTLFGLEYMTDRNERFRALKAIEEGIPVLVDKYKVLLNPTLDLEIATMLFDLNELLSKYADIPNKILLDKSKAKTEKSQKFVQALIRVDRGFKQNMNEYLGDDPCVSGNFKKKFIEVTNWITNAFYNRINTDKLNELFSYDILDVAVKSKVLKVNEESNKMLRYSTWAFRNWKNLCYLINELTSRTSLIEVAFESLKDNGIDKKELTHLKSTITRTNNLIETLYNLLNYGEDNPNDETMNKFRDFYGFLPVVDLEKISKLEKLIA